MKRLARTLRLGAFAAACICLALATGLLVLEQSGWLVRRFRAECMDRLGQPVQIADVHLRWFAGAIVLEDLVLDTPGGGLRIERATVTLGRGEHGVVARRIELQGGRAVLSQVLVDRLRLLLESGAPPEATVEQLPTLVVRELQVDFSDPDWGYVPLGRVDVVARADDSGKPVIEGRIIPTLAVRAKEADGGIPEIYLGGHEVSPGRFEIHGSTEGIPVNVDALPEGTGLEVFRPYAPRGVLALDAQVFISLDGSEPPSGSVRAALTGGSILPTTIDTPFEDLRVELFARCQPAPGVQLLDPKAWQSTASLNASWHDSPISAWALFGRNSGPGLSARGWLVARDLPLSRDALGGLGIDESKGLSTAWEALALRGVADVVVGLRAPAEGQVVDLSIEVQADGDAGVTYVGWPGRKTGTPQGVPLPVEEVSGRLLIALDTRRETPMRIGWLGVDGVHSGGQDPTQRVHSDGLVISAAPGERYARFDLRYGGEGLTADEELRIALQGLAGTDFIWPMFQPGGGSSSFEAHMIRTAGMAGAASRFVFAIEGLSGVFASLPAPINSLAGSLELVFDQRHAFGAAFELQGRSTTSESVLVSGRIQEDPALTFGSGDRALRDIAVVARGVALRGIDRDVVAAALPGVGAALESVGAVGKVDVDYRLCTALPGGATRQTVTVTPGVVEVSPENFKVRTTGVRGRVLVQALDQHEGPGTVRVTTRLRPLIGDWSGNAKVAVLGDIDPTGAAELYLMGTGLDVSNRVLAGAFREALAPGRSGSEGVDLGALAVDGRVDLTGKLVLSGSSAALDERGENSYRIFLRDNDLETNSAVRFGLRGLHGSLVQRGKVLYGESITARLGSTPLTLRTAEFSVEEDGTYQFETRLEARDLPLDREHMRHFLDEPALEALVEGLGWSGRVDIDDALLRVSGSQGEAGGEVELRGHATLTDMTLNIGLPLAITQASVNIESLILKNGHVRAWATVEGLDGRIADRELEDARLALTYIEPHLSLLDLDGRFEKGRLRNLGTEGSSGPAFSIDLKEPFPFGVAIRLVDVDVSSLLRGLFESDFASEGLLSAELRLVGDLDHITGIRGDGRVDLTESTLWSIPVMRNLFSQLGFDNTAVFEEMRARFRIASGKVHMEEMQVESPLLSLVGEGTLDFDGRMDHELRVHYDLIDHFGPLTRLAYFIQNNLLRVSIRGDMSRPRVELQGALSFLQGFKTEGRELPLPSFSPLPERF